MRLSVSKDSNDSHHTNDLGNGTISHRRIIPGSDGRIKVTNFLGKAGWHAEGIEYGTDETVYLVSGKVSIRTAQETYVLGAGACYVAHALVKYDLEVLEDCEAICVFSIAGRHGIYPDDK